MFPISLIIDENDTFHLHLEMVEVFAFPPQPLRNLQPRWQLGAFGLNLICIFSQIILIFTSAVKNNAQLFLQNHWSCSNGIYLYK